MAAIIKPTTVEDITVAVNEKIERRKFKQAQVEGEKFLDGKPDASGHLAWALAKASAQIGDYYLAIKYAGQALRVNAISGPRAMVEPLLEPIRSDVRFVMLVAESGGTEIPAVEPRNSTRQASPQTPSTTIRMDAQGIDVKAGDIVLKLPN